jgi:hypothetical protein
MAHLNTIDRSRLFLGIPSGARLGAALLLAGAIQLQAQPSGPSLRISTAISPTSAQDLPHLFTPLPQALGKGPLPERVLSMERVALQEDVLGLPAFIVSVEGRELVAEKVSSEWHATSEMLLYRVEGEELFSTFTKSYNGIVFGHIQANGKSYFLSGQGDEHLVVSSIPVLFPEIVHYPFLTQPISSSIFSSATSGRRRAVRSGSSPVTVGVNIAICLDYRDAVGGTDKAIARVNHMIDRQNNAYRSSSFYGRFEIRDIYFVDPPNEVVKRGLYKWATTPGSPVIEARKRTKAAATIVLSQGSLSHEALRTAPYPIDPDDEVAISGGFWAEWDDSDIHSTMHENGHLSGGDHNPESSFHPPDDPQISARDWYSCEEGIYGLLSYNVCDKFLKRVEMYSGLNAVYAGKVRGNEMQNNVGMFGRVFVFMTGAHE